MNPRQFLVSLFTISAFVPLFSMVMGVSFTHALIACAVCQLAQINYSVSK